MVDGLAVEDASKTGHPDINCLELPAPSRASANAYVPELGVAEKGNSRKRAEMGRI